MLEHALKYASLGWAVFPCRPGDKIPATPHGCLDATTDPDQIRAWWSEAPNCNIGLACGEPSGVVALDLDARSGGTEFWAAALDDNGPLPEGVYESQTGGGGTHYLFAFGNEPNYDIAPGVEIKSTGKYIVVPPSIHPNGIAYEWELSSSPIEEDETTAENTDLAGGDDTAGDNIIDISNIFGLPQ